jgi:two-component system osmolarity sensor histidine kinase EnvZ
MATTADQARPAGPIRGLWQRLVRLGHDLMPTGLFPRALIIIIAPVVLLQAVIVFAFTERHWQQVTERLAEAVVGDIATVVDIMARDPSEAAFAEVQRIAGQRMRLNITFRPGESLPAPAPKPFFSPLDALFSTEMARQIKRPFWIDTVGRSSLIEFRVKLDAGVLQVFARRNEAYVSSSQTLIAAMIATSLVLLGVAILFLRNQIQPILTLTAAVDDFGKGRAVHDFPPRGAREVRQATIAFQDMRRRVERMIEQRTAMLAGVSHDLRTVLTRLRLQLALLEETADVDELTADVDAMSRMLEGYLAFARGDSGERPVAVDLAELLEEVADDAAITGGDVEVEFSGGPIVHVRPQGFKRCIENLVTNASRHAEKVMVSGRHADGQLTITVDDDGPGIPREEREAVFRPFYRLDNARNLDRSGTGLGLPIARDIARSHGGDIMLSDSPLGGLRATVRVPV